MIYEDSRSAFSPWKDVLILNQPVLQYRMIALHWDIVRSTRIRKHTPACDGSAAYRIFHRRDYKCLLHLRDFVNGVVM